jgi:hypothetical protein
MVSGDGYKTGDNAKIHAMSKKIPVANRPALAANVGLANNADVATLVLTKAEGDALRAEIEALKAILINVGIMLAP